MVWYSVELMVPGSHHANRRCADGLLVVNTGPGNYGYTDPGILELMNHPLAVAWDRARVCWRSARV